MWDVLRDAESLPGLQSAAADVGAQVRGHDSTAIASALAEGSLVDAVGALVNEIGYHDEINRNYNEPLEQQSSLGGGRGSGQRAGLL